MKSYVINTAPCFEQELNHSAYGQQATRCMSGYAPAHFKTDKQLAAEQLSHMNAMPVPEGAWQENHNKRNAKFNMQIAVSLSFLILTTVAMWKTNIFYLHDAPPMTPMKK